RETETPVDRPRSLNDGGDRGPHFGERNRHHLSKSLTQAPRCPRPTHVDVSLDQGGGPPESGQAPGREGRGSCLPRVAGPRTLFVLGAPSLPQCPARRSCRQPGAAEPGGAAPGVPVASRVLAERPGAA